MFPLVMLGHLRSTQAVRTAVCLAAILSLAGSAGLHAEPAGAPAAGSPVRLTAGPGVGPGAPQHICQLCVLYYAGSLVPTAPAAPADLTADASVVPQRPSSGGRVEGHRHEGRAPPLAS